MPDDNYFHSRFRMRFLTVFGENCGMFWVLKERNFVCTQKHTSQRNKSISNVPNVARKTGKNKNYTGHIEKHHV